MAETSSILETEPFPADLRRNLTIILISWGIFGACWWNAVLGVPYTLFAVRMGATPLFIGLLSAAAMLGVVGNLLSSYLIERTGHPKAVFLVAMLIQRPLWILIGALPFLIPPRYGAWRLAGLLGLTLLSSVLGSTGGPAWVSWMAHVIPQRIRARFLGIRFRLVTITGMITALVVGKVLDWNSSYHTFFAIFGIAAVMGTIDITLFFFIPRPAAARSAEPPSLLALLRIPWSDRRFRRYLFYAGASSASYTGLGQFVILYLLEGIHLSKLYTNIYVLAGPALVAALFGPVVGRYVTNFGNRPVLMVTTLLAIPLPMLYGAAGHNSHPLLAFAALVAGVVTAVLGVVELNLMFAMTPEAKRSAYLAAVALVFGLVGAAAPVAWGLMAQALTGWHTSVAGFTLTNLHVVFLAGSAVRIVHAAIFVPRLPEAEARPARELVADMLRAPVDAAGTTMRRLRRR